MCAGRNLERDSMNLVKRGLVATILSLAAWGTHQAQATDPDILCLASVIYHEARGEPLSGQLAVAKVTLNRTEHKAFPSTVCGVVYQPNQYSWTKKPQKIRDRAAWQEALDLAQHSLETNLENLDHFKALYFQSTSSKKKFKRKQVAKIGKHVFYK